MESGIESTVAESFLQESVKNFRQSQAHIIHCLDQIDDTILWWRPFEEANSIANILLHLCGNIRQWVIAPLTNTPDVRIREAEFTERGPIPIEQLKSQFTSVIESADNAISTYNPLRLLEPLRIQGYDVTVMGALYNSISHLRGHEQEIVFMTRLNIGTKYRFWTDPTTLNRPGR